MSRIYSRAGSVYAKTGAASRQPLRRSNACYLTGDYGYATPFVVCRFSSCAIPAKSGKYLPIIPYQTQKYLESGQILERTQSSIARTFSGSVAMPFCPRYLTFGCKRVHLKSFSFRVFESFENHPQTTNVCLEVWGGHYDVIEVDQQCLPVKSAEDVFHQPLKSGRAEVNPNDNTLQFHSSSRVMNATFSWASGLRETCQYPLNKSNALKYLLPAKTFLQGRG